MPHGSRTHSIVVTKGWKHGKPCDGVERRGGPSREPGVETDEPRPEVELTAAKEAMRKMKEKQHKNKNLKASRKNEVSISEEQNKQ